MAVSEFLKDFYIINDGRVKAFLITDAESPLLIDTGFPDADVAAIVKEKTDKTPRIILTHGDMDHTGGLKHFDACVCMIHEADRHMISERMKVSTVADGEKICAGGYCFEIIHIPGHTGGSIALFEREKRLLLPGDTLNKGGQIFMFGKERNLDRYIESLQKLRGYEDKIDTIIPSHGEYPLGSEYIAFCLADAQKLRAGELEGEKHPFMPCSNYKGEHTEFLYAQES